MPDTLTLQDDATGTTHTLRVLHRVRYRRSTRVGFALVEAEAGLVVDPGTGRLSVVSIGCDGERIGDAFDLAELADLARHVLAHQDRGSITRALGRLATAALVLASLIQDRPRKKENAHG